MPAYPGVPGNSQTFLVLSVMGIPFYSARGLSQVLRPCDASKGNTVLRRSVNGILIDMTHAMFRKYASTITCTDVRAPALNGIYPGLTIQVDCVCELAYPTGGSAARTVVPSSSYTEQGFVFYRPRLSMMVMDFHSDRAEWDGTAPWQLDLEEV
jgi:hypothetical protein